MENDCRIVPESNKTTEEFFSILEKCTLAQKQYFAGVLDGMKYCEAERRLSADNRSA